MKYDILYEQLMSGLLFEQNLGYIALMPGGFKPPHKGHFELLKAYVEDPAISKVILMLGPTPRRSTDKSLTIDNNMAKNIWKEYIQHLSSNKIQLIEVGNPYTAAYEYVQDDALEGDTIVFVASVKDASDAARSDKFAADHSSETGKYHKPGVNVIHYPKDTVAVYVNRGDDNDGEAISATIMRDDAAGNNITMFKTNLPDEVRDQADKILGIMNSGI